jgi:hypothetical protein
MIEKCACGAGEETGPFTITGHRSGCPKSKGFAELKANLSVLSEEITASVRSLADSWPGHSAEIVIAWEAVLGELGFVNGPPNEEGGPPIPRGKWEPQRRYREVNGQFLCAHEDGTLVVDRGATIAVADAATLAEIVEDLAAERDRLKAKLAGKPSPATSKHRARLVPIDPPPPTKTIHEQATKPAPELRGDLAMATHVIAYDRAGILHREAVAAREADGVPAAFTYRARVTRDAHGVQWAFINAIGIPMFSTSFDAMNPVAGQYIEFEFTGTLPG